MHFQRRYLFALAIPLVGGVAYYAFQPARPPKDALPADSFAALTIDADALRASSLGPTFQDYVRQFAKLPAGCNVDISERLDEAALAVAEGKPELGVALAGRLTEAELASCKTALQKPESSAAATTEFDHGSFHVSKSQLGAQQMHIAWNRRGPITLGIGDFTLHMLDAADGKTSRIGASGDVHGELRAALTSRAKTRVGVLFTLRPTAALRTEFANYIPQGSYLERAKPLTTLSAFGIAFVPGVKDGEAELLAEARCDDEGLCEKVKELVLRQRFEFGKNFAVRLGGFGPILDNLTVEREGKRLTLRTHDSAEALARNLAQAKGLVSLSDLVLPGLGKHAAPEVPKEVVPAPKPTQSQP